MALSLAIPAAIKGISIGRLLIAAYMASMGLDVAGRVGKYGLERRQVDLQAQMAKAQIGATKMSVRESRARSKEYIAALMKAKREEAGETRELMAMQSFTQSQDRQMALVMQAMQALSQRPGAPTQAPGGGGMLGLMRGGF